MQAMRNLFLTSAAKVRIDQLRKHIQPYAARYQPYFVFNQQPYYTFFSVIGKTTLLSLSKID